ncbi:MAG: NAD-dependent epimerase/dehydratase family protein [Acidobacteria bacterium]|nr:NAD-dependent epimerase/dehydratase family protein [Acidobacteriota bacterium]
MGSHDAFASGGHNLEHRRESRPNETSGRVVVTGAAGSIGRRVAGAFPDAMPNWTVVGIDRVAAPPIPGVDHKIADLAVASLRDYFDGADAVVHAATALRFDAVSEEDVRLELAITRRVLDEADVAGVRHVILLSSAMVYGAWPDNAMPLSEQAPLRPIADLDFAVHKVEVERLGEEWRRRGDGRRLTVLRPAITVSEDGPGTLGAMMVASNVVRSEDGDAAVQFLHVEDLASAVACATARRYDGVLNVAPDGWISPDGFAALTGPKPRIRLPDALARAFTSARFKLGLAPTPPGVVAYSTYSWVVANDRLRALGWTPRNTNEEAYVSGFDPGPLDRLTARKRQELALGVAGVGIAALVCALIWTVLRIRRQVR